MDNNFKKVLQSIVNLETEKKISLAVSAIGDIAPELQKHFDSAQSAKIIVAIFATSVAADGKLNSNEFALFKSFMNAMGIKMSDDEYVKLISNFSDKDSYQAIHALNKILTADGKASLVMLVAAICAIDDRIDPNETSFLEDLYNG